MNLLHRLDTSVMEHDRGRPLTSPPKSDDTPGKYHPVSHDSYPADAADVNVPVQLEPARVKNLLGLVQGHDSPNFLILSASSVELST